MIMASTKMTTPTELARRALLEPAGLTDLDLEKILSSILGHSVDSADLYFHGSRMESWTLEDGIIQDASYSVDHGVGVRAISGEKTGFAYSDDIVLPALQQAASAARTIAVAGSNSQVKAWDKNIIIPHNLYLPDDPLHSLPDAEKIDLLHSINVEARRIDPRISQVIVSLAGSHQVMLIVASDGTFSADIRPMVRLNVSVVAEHKGKRERASYGGGGRLDYKLFLKDDLGKSYAQEAVRQALINLEAVAAPAGNMPVVLGPGWPGILLHEAIGHGLEGDFNRKKSSAFSGRIGERVASTQCTIVDDGTIPGRRGSLNVDDEGVPSQCTTLIENGILKGYMQDKMNARLMGTKSTGNGRRESYAHTPMPRMTNTYMLAGKYDPDEIIASVEKGLYAVSFSGGQVDITSGKFVFNASEAYLIENGKITKPVKGASLIGSGPDILTKVSMVGNNLELDQGVGVCGKEGQSVPVGVGQPTILVDEITVGGTDHSY
jgi:TldD protein